MVTRGIAATTNVMTERHQGTRSAFRSSGPILINRISSGRFAVQSLSAPTAGVCEWRDVLYDNRICPSYGHAFLRTGVVCDTRSVHNRAESGKTNRSKNPPSSQCADRRKPSGSPAVSGKGRGLSMAEPDVFVSRGAWQLPSVKEGANVRSRVRSAARPATEIRTLSGEQIGTQSAGEAPTREATCRPPTPLDDRKWSIRLAGRRKGRGA